PRRVASSVPSSATARTPGYPRAHPAMLLSLPPADITNERDGQRRPGNVGDAADGEERVPDDELMDRGADVDGGAEAGGRQGDLGEERPPPEPNQRGRRASLPIDRAGIRLTRLSKLAQDQVRHGEV